MTPTFTAITGDNSALIERANLTRFAKNHLPDGFDLPPLGRDLLGQLSKTSQLSTRGDQPSTRGDQIEGS